jgi:hypothetical protein
MPKASNIGQELTSQTHASALYGNMSDPPILFVRDTWISDDLSPVLPPPSQPTTLPPSK